MRYTEMLFSIVFTCYIITHEVSVYYVSTFKYIGKTIGENVGHARTVWHQ